MNNLELLLPVCDGGVTKSFVKGKHLGVDFGYKDVVHCPILAVFEGKVVDVFYSNSCGYSIVIQHEFEGKHFWSAYIHMRQPTALKVNDKVVMGDTVGYRGNTGNSNGNHLHLYVSNLTDKTYSWNYMKALCNYDPLPLFRKSREFEYTLATLDKYKVNKIPYFDEATDVEALRKTIQQLENRLKKYVEIFGNL